MKPDAIVIRHSECGLPESLIGYVDLSNNQMQVMEDTSSYSKLF